MHHPICYYIPSHMLAHINVARARGLAEPGPAQQSAKVSEAFRQRRQQAALASLTPTPPSPGRLHDIGGRCCSGPARCPS